MKNLDCVLKNGDITLPKNVCLVKAMVFPVVMYACEIWSIKKSESRRADAFELWCWRRLLRVPWKARRSNQSILKSVLNIHWKDWCWSRNSNTLATWCEELTHLKRPWCWERLKAKGEEGSSRWDGWIASPTQWTWTWANSRRYWRTGKPSVLHGITKSQTRLSDWTTVITWMNMEADSSSVERSDENPARLILLLQRCEFLTRGPS